MFDVCQNDVQIMLNEVFKLVPIVFPAALAFLGLKVTVRYIIDLVKNAF